MTGPERGTGKVEKTLSDITRVVAAARRLAAEGKVAYDRSEVSRLAAEALVTRLGEAVSSLPEAFRSDHPGIPWDEIRGMRNLIAHEYHRTDVEIVWVAVSERIPELARELGLDVPPDLPIHPPATEA